MKQSQKQKYTFYLGTYTNEDSEGIYRYKLHPDGSLESAGLAARSENPSFLVVDPEQQILLAVNEIQNETGVGTVETYRITNDSLTFLSRGSSGGAHPCFVAFRDGLVLIANYTGGNVAVLKLDSLGHLSDILDLQQHTGMGVSPRQQGPHAHSVWFGPTNKDILAADLGTNEIWISQLDREQGLLSEPARLRLEPEAGPRHLAIHPNGTWIYAVNELNSTITLIDHANNQYQLRESFSTLPDGFSEKNFPSHILITGDGRYLYAANRGHNSIAIFSILKDGTLELKGHESCGGDWPRHFVLSPDERFLLVANQRSRSIVSLARDVDNGGLRYSSAIPAPIPACIAF